METVNIETLSSPLRLFGLESSQSSTSNHSEPDGAEAEVKHNDLLEKLKNLSFEDVLDSKCRISKNSNKISEVTSQVKDNSGILTFVKNEEVDENLLSSVKNKKISKVVETGEESTFCKCSNKNCEIPSEKKNRTEKFSFVENLENVENRLSSLSLNNKLLNGYYKNGSGILSGDESDSDDDEQVESVVLRERNPIKHNRPEPNKEHRTTPFTRNHRKTYDPRLNSNDYHIHGNSSSHTLNGFKTSHDDASICHFNDTDFETYRNVSPNLTLHLDFPTSEFVTHDTFEQILSSTVADQIFNNLPCIAANPRTVTDQIVDVTPYTELDSDIGSLNDKFFEEIIDSQRFDNLKEKIFLGSAVNTIEKETCLEPRVEEITEEELNNIINLSDSILDDLSNQNLVNLIDETLLNLPSSKETEKVFSDPIFNQNACESSPVKEVNYLNNNQYNFHPEPDHGHSSFPKSKVEESSLFSNLYSENDIFENVGQLHNYKHLGNKPIKNKTAISYGSVSSKTTDYIITSNEIEKEIVKVKEKNALNNMPELSCEIDWDALPFELEDSECMKTQENKKGNKKEYSEIKDINQVCKSPCKAEKTKICWMLKTEARDKLFNSPSFCKRKWEEENEKIRQQIKSGMLGTKKNKVIFVLKKHWKTKYRGTNLHYAILSGFTELVFCLVEWHKKCHDGIAEINLRDSFNKTVLDYSKEKGMDLLSDYLKENTAKESINI